MWRTRDGFVSKQDGARAWHRVPLGVLLAADEVVE